MYVAFTALYFSAAFWLENLWVFGTLLAALWVISRIVIPREERFMKAKFGAEYESYASRTRRWI
jgi:protein-S-isoprenylcysteine O-methyltransferase Ste14